MHELKDKPFARALGNGEVAQQPTHTRVTGVIFHIDYNRGFAFVTSDAHKFTRIFLHWTGLEEDTLHFTELKRRMKLEFEVKIFDQEGKKRYRAIRAKVLGVVPEHEMPDLPEEETSEKAE